MGKTLNSGGIVSGRLGHRSSVYLRGFVYIGLILSVQFTLVGLVYVETGEKILYTKLGSDDIAEVSEFLNEKGIAFRISDEGTTILVRGNVEKIQAELEDTEWRETRLKQKTMLKSEDLVKIEANPDPHRMDAIRKELEKLLKNGSERIQWARVGFQHDEKEGLEEGEGTKGAAVFIGIGGKTIPSVDVERIQWVVANSFAGLRPSDVTVHDEVGHELTHEVGD